MANRSLSEIINEMIDADRVRLPVHPKVAEQVADCMAEDSPDPRRLWTLVGNDPALLCNLFRAANSSFYSGLHKTLSIEEAVTRLGEEKASQIVAQACHVGDSGPGGELLARYLPDLWRHARGCALGARWLANRSGYQGLADQAYLAGLLHDIGKLFLLAALEEVSSCAEFTMEVSEALVEEVISAMHVEQGLRLCEEWDLPEVYKGVIAGHHTEDLDQQDIIDALVRLANKGCRRVGLGLESQPDIVLPTTGEAQFLGIGEIPLAEFEIMLEDAFLGGAP